MPTQPSTTESLQQITAGLNSLSRTERFLRWLLPEPYRRERRMLGVLRELAERDRTQRHDLDRLAGRAASAESEAAGMRNTLRAAYESIEQLQATLPRQRDALLQELGRHLQITEALQEDIAALRQEQLRGTEATNAVEGRFEKRIEAIRQQCAVLAEQLGAAAQAGAGDLAAQLEAIARRLQPLEDLAITTSAGTPGLGSFAARVLAVEAALAPLHQALASATTERLGAADEIGGHAAAALEQFYLAFENRYRGSLVEISDRQKVYLPRLAGLSLPDGALRSSLRIVDLGCGRGEWLEVLHTAGFTGAVGVDSSSEMIRLCRNHRLPVEQADALGFLRAQPGASCAAVTAMHLVEHLAFPVLLALLAEARRVLVPDGLLILETPNCENVLVSARTFRLDPTHRFPLPPLLLSFSAEFSGFSTVEILPLHPNAAEQQVASDSELARRFNAYFYGPQDYALLAHNA